MVRFGFSIRGDFEVTLLVWGSAVQLFGAGRGVAGMQVGCASTYNRSIRGFRRNDVKDAA